jgi:hypothetical protein
MVARLAAMFVGVLLAVSATVLTGTTVLAQSTDNAPFPDLKRLLVPAGPTLSLDSARKIGFELTRQQYVVTVLDPARVNDLVLQELANLLADRQLQWQEGRRAPITEVGLEKALNKHLELDKVPEFLKIRPSDISRIRARLWVDLPELSTESTNVKNRKAGNRLKPGMKVTSSRMSPFEAFLVCDLLLYEKTFNEDFVRTAGEEQVMLGSPRQPRRQGLQVLPPNPRGDSFRNHLTSLGRTKWPTAHDVFTLVTDILEEGAK